jgi:hypothetical protein
MSSMTTLRLSNDEMPAVELSTTKPSRKRTAPSTKSTQYLSDDAESMSFVHEAGACCLCHCALDYSDLAAFDAEARAEDYSDDETDDASEYIFRKTDPFLPKDPLYHPQNALVYCDTCHRWFHQACHFVPIFVIPTAAFTCLICQYEEKQQPKLSRKKKTKPLPTTTYPLLSTMFQSPPVSGMLPFEKAWECDSVVMALKVSGWQDQLHHRLERKIHSALQKYRRSQRTLETLLVQSSPRTRQWHLGTASEHAPRRVSQELVQCLVAYTTAKVTLRQTMWALEWVRQLAGQRAAWSALQDWIQATAASHGDFVQRILFPFGTQHPRRWHPVTSEYTDPIRHWPPLPVPDEVHIVHPESATGRGTMALRSRCSRRTTVPTNDTAKTKQNKQTPKPPPAANATVKPTRTTDDDDSGISLDQLQCCICLSGDCTVENDLLLCDGAHCHRAYHMACLPGSSHLDAAQYEALDDWFCPLCQTQAECLYQIQRHVQRLRHDDDDDWERRRWSRTEGDADSLQSWDQVQDVFPEADEEYNLVQKLRRRRGVCDAEQELRRLLTPILGPDILGVEPFETQDHDSDEEDDNFDPEQRGAEDDADDRSTGSPVSLADLSSVELHVPAEEVVALSKEQLLLSPHRRRLSLRLSRRDTYDPGQMDLANILKGKRPRRRIDYRQLNDALFGQLSERELQEWDA